MTVAYDRLHSVMGPYLTQEVKIGKTEDAVRAILNNEHLRAAFEYEREGVTRVLSSAAILGWLRTARYWDLLSSDLLGLTEYGEKFKTGDFGIRLQRHLAVVLPRKWEVELQTIKDSVGALRSSDAERRPDTRNWYRLVATESKIQIPQTRFRQLIGFLRGCGACRREICHLYFIE